MYRNRMLIKQSDRKIPIFDTTESSINSIVESILERR